VDDREDLLLIPVPTSTQVPVLYVKCSK
jgi:hypothetical protein